MSAYDDKSLYEYLLSLKVVDQNLLYQALSDSRFTKTPFQDVLISRDLITNDDLGQVLSDLTHFPLAKLSNIFIPKEVLSLISPEFAKQYGVVAFERTNEGISVAMEDPSNTGLINLITQRTGLPVKAFIATNGEIENALAKYSKEISEVFRNIVAEKLKASKGKPMEEMPIDEILDAVINYAYDNKASDIHVEPLREHSVIRCRVDGVLQDIAVIPKPVHEQLVNKIKFLSNLRTDEHRSAQDGKFIFKTKEELDIRVSIVPTVKGERISMRLLSEKSRQFGLNELGLTDENMQKVTEAYKKPFGMILAVGPTGSGKTTTLYAILRLLNKRGINIMTVEDPVEYEIEGVNQIQVDPNTNLTFAEGLRSIARQDPNIILVGEIRDKETAGIAVNSSLTGHLVLSSMHANDAATTFPRLMDFGIEPFLIASTVNVVIAQRLVRRICPSCRVGQTVDVGPLRERFSTELVNRVFGDTNQIDVYMGKSCAICKQTGYMGRIAVFEVLEINEEIRRAIVAKEDAGSIRQLAIMGGMKTMNEDGLQKVKEGITTIEEIMRTAEEA